MLLNLYQKFKYYLLNLTYITLGEAVIKFGIKTQCYYYNSHDKMWREGFNFTEKEYYLFILLGEVEDKNLRLYGKREFSSTKKLEPIPSNYISQESFIRNSQYDTLYSKLGEPLYTNVRIKRKELYKVIKKFQSLYGFTNHPQIIAE